MGRKRVHDERTGEALLDAAERLVHDGGVAALSVRALADEVGASTRAVYSVFGSKEALLVALGRRASDWLATQLDGQTLTDDPVADLVEAGAGTFRRLVTEHPVLFRIGIQKYEVPPDLVRGFAAASRNARRRLEARIHRVADAGLLGEWTEADAAQAFHGLCEGLASLELRGVLGDSPDRLWREAATALVRGFRLPMQEATSRTTRHTRTPSVHRTRVARG